jgi:hypothetical protein
MVACRRRINNQRALLFQRNQSVLALQHVTEESRGGFFLILFLFTEAELKHSRY